MGNIFFTSDTHFGHANILTFKNDDTGGLIRPGFSSIDEMDETLIERWNAVVRDGDKVYHLGDVSFAYGSPLASIMSRLRGQKRLVLGNHDRLKGTNLAQQFAKISVWRIFKEHGFLCSHVPIHPDSFRKVAVNVHGHIHERKLADPRYLNVCVEQTDYRPLELEEVKHRAGIIHSHRMAA